MNRGALWSLGVVIALSCGACLVGCSDQRDRPSTADQAIAQTTFASPEDAVVALIDAARAGEVVRVRPLFGPGVVELESDSPQRTEGDLQRLAAAYDRRSALFIDDVDGGRAYTLAVGDDLWEFPVPIVRTGDRYRFDTATGIERVRAQRVETNEADAVDFLIGCVAAQEEFRRLSGGAYATRFRSTPGTRDGLWWPDELGPPRSPLGPMSDDPRVAQATIDASASGDVFLGYRYRILTAAGVGAPGGQISWLDDTGRLTGGFAFLAWPAEFGESGEHTFLVSMQGDVWARDYGTSTDEAVTAIVRFDPDGGWRRVE